jgi:L-cystine transport system substrate-binding protein
MKKRNIWKKTGVVLTCAAMATALLAGCGSSSSSSGSSEAAASSGTSATSTASGGGDGSIAAMKDNGDGTYTVTVAVLDGMAPYTYTDENGDFQGYDYEYMQALDEKLDKYTFKYESVGADAAPAAIQAGTYAMSVSAHFVTPARAENFILSIPESYYPVNLISRTEDSFTSFEQLDGKSLVPNPPNDGLSVVLSQMSEQYPDVKYTQDPTSEYIPYLDGVEDVVRGQYDCWFGGETMYRDLIESNPELESETFCSDPITTAGCVCVINKNLTAFREAVNEATVELYNDGTLASLSEKYLGQDYFKTAEDTGSLFDYAGYTADNADWYEDTLK